jgi:hypothetical protein
MISCQIAEQGRISGKSRRIRVERRRVSDPVYRLPPLDVTHTTGQDEHGVSLKLFWLLGIEQTAGGDSVNGTQRWTRTATGVRAMGLLGPRRPMRCFGLGLACLDLGLGMGLQKSPNQKMESTENRELQVRMTEAEMGFHGCHDRCSKMLTRKLSMSVGPCASFLVIRSSKASKTREGTYCWYEVPVQATSMLAGQIPPWAFDGMRD